MMRDLIFVYGQDHCPKCDQLKSFLEDLGVPFRVLDMAEHKNYLDSNDGWPFDAGAPTLELRDPTSYDETCMYSHHILFQGGNLNTEVIKNIVGMGQVLK